MALEIKVPVLPESVSDATVATWHKKVGDLVRRDEHLVDIETDKVVLEVVAPADGVLEAITKPTGSTVLAQEVIGMVQAGAVAAAPAPSVAPQPTVAAPVAAPTPIAAVPVSVGGPAARRAAAQGQSVPVAAPKSAVATVVQQSAPMTVGKEERVPMTRLRSRIAERLVQAQHTAAILTTFNEINMKPIMDLRQKYKDGFEKTHGVRLGFMSFFTKAASEALKRFPIVNAAIDGNDIVYHGYCDIGIAVSSPRGLVVPILRQVEGMHLATIEKKIAEYGEKARDGQLTLEEMMGGTFTISNGGVFGSLLSTPIINPPQSAILGMHKIEERPVVENGQIVIRPMMYVALSYDHRLIDGADSVRFLVTIKELLEDPTRFLLEI